MLHNCLTAIYYIVCARRIKHMYFLPQQLLSTNGSLEYCASLQRFVASLYFISSRFLPRIAKSILHSLLLIQHIKHPRQQENLLSYFPNLQDITGLVTGTLWLPSFYQLCAVTVPQHPTGTHPLVARDRGASYPVCAPFSSSVAVIDPIKHQLQHGDVKMPSLLLFLLALIHSLARLPSSSQTCVWYSQLCVETVLWSPPAHRITQQPLKHGKALSLQRSHLHWIGLQQWLLLPVSKAEHRIALLPRFPLSMRRSSVRTCSVPDRKRGGADL